MINHPPHTTSPAPESTHHVTLATCACGALTLQLRRVQPQYHCHCGCTRGHIGCVCR